MKNNGILAGILISLLLLVTACGGNSATSSQGGTAGQDVLKSGSIKIAIEGAYPPYNYINSQNQLELPIKG